MDPMQSFVNCRRKDGLDRIMFIVACLTFFIGMPLPSTYGLVVVVVPSSSSASSSTKSSRHYRPRNPMLWNQQQQQQRQRQQQSQQHYMTKSSSSSSVAATASAAATENVNTAKQQEKEALAATATTTAAAATTAAASFTTGKMQVYIEDTDAYGVIYNSNYLRIYDRALHVAGMQFQHKNKNKAATDSNDNSNNDNDSINNDECCTVYGTSLILSSSSQQQQHNHEHDAADWSILELRQQKFKASPELGGSFVVVGQLVSVDESSAAEEWDLTIQSSSTSSSESSDETATAVVYNTARLVIGPYPSRRHRWNTAVSSSSSLPVAVKKNEKNIVTTTTLDTYTCYRDEFDMHMPGVLPLRSILNLFERSRTNYLGGPEALRNLQVNNDILFVVTSIHDFALVQQQTSSTMINSEPRQQQQECIDNNDNNSILLLPGQKVGVATDFVTKRNGMVIECWQSLIVFHDDNNNINNESSVKRTIAHGIVTIMTLNGSTKRPTSKLPSWLGKKLALPSSD